MHWDVSRLVGGRRSDVGVEVGKARRSVGHFSVDGLIGGGTRAGRYRWIVPLLHFRDAAGPLTRGTVFAGNGLVGGWSKIPWSAIARITPSPHSGGPKNGGVETIPYKYAGPTPGISVSAISRWVDFFLSGSPWGGFPTRALVDIRMAMSWRQPDRSFRYTPLYSGTSPLSLKHSGLGAVAPNRDTHPIGQHETSDLGHLLVLSHAQMAKRVLRGTTFTPGILGF